MSEQHLKVLNYWSLLFGALAIVLIAINRGLSVASAHAVLMMLFVRQVSIVLEKELVRLKVEHLEMRLNAFDPYAPDIDEDQ